MFVNLFSVVLRAQLQSLHIIYYHKTQFILYCKCMQSNEISIIDFKISKILIRQSMVEGRKVVMKNFLKN